MTERSARMQKDRRGFLEAAGMAALAPFLGGLAAAAPPAAGPAAAGPMPAVVAAGGVFLVNGWVLTRADLAALGLPAPLGPHAR